MNRQKLRNLIFSALLLSVGMLLPFLTGQVKQIGNMLLPMHLPVMMCGLLCGPWYGLAVGLILPLLRSVTFGMPILYPTAISMAFELGTYGLIIGLLFSRSKWKCLRALYFSLISAMICGRIVWGICQVILLGLGKGGFTLGLFWTGAVANAIPGIILQLILIPALMLLIGKTHLMPKKRRDQNETIDSKA